MPESLANSLAYLNSILNSRLFIQCSKVSADNRIQEILRINSYNFYAFAMRYYPKMYPLTLDIYDHEPHPGNTIEDED